MNQTTHNPAAACVGPMAVNPFNRREFLSRFGLGLAGIALGQLLNPVSVRGAAAGTDRGVLGQPHFTPRAKRVIYLFMAGGPSQLETFDYKPVLRRFGFSREKAVAAAGTPRLEELPATPEALNWYDVVLLLDPDPESLGPDWGSLLRGFAEQHAGGILYMPGPRFATHWISSPDTAGIREILPVTWLDAESIEAVELLEPLRSDVPKTADSLGICYLRGRALMASGKPADAEREFRKVIDHHELAPFDVVQHLAIVGLAEARCSRSRPKASRCRSCARRRMARTSSPSSV